MIATEVQIRVASQNFHVCSVEYCPIYKPKTDLRIEQSIEFMAQHLNQPMQVTIFATRANISSSHYFTLFKRLIGSSPMDYFTRLRMRRACELLKNTSMSIKEIASEMGYHDPLYFSRVFKSVNRIAPSGYRTAHCGMTGKTAMEVRDFNYFNKSNAISTSGRMFT
jgi:AraC-like DNA-binding protein